jgi:hypothetical protein
MFPVTIRLWSELVTAIVPTPILLVNSLQNPLNHLISAKVAETNCADVEKSSSDKDTVYNSSTNQRFIEMPFIFSNKYNWSAFQKESDASKTQQIRMPEDFILMQVNIGTELAWEYCSWLGMACKESNIENSHYKLALIRQAVRASIKTLLQKFWVAIGNKLGMRVN